MKLYVIRHAPAVDRSPDGTDETRALTLEGREQFARVVAALGARGVHLDQLLHSPLVRAVETAGLCRPLFDGAALAVEDLVRSPTPALLRSCRGQRVGLVGHEPWQSELVAWLVTGRRELGPRFALEKGAVAVLDGLPEPGAMSLEFFASPGWLVPGARA